MFQLLAHRRKDTVRSVCHAHESNCFSAGLIAAEGRWALVDEPEVTMPAGLRDRCLAWVDPRAEGRFGVDHPLDADGVTGHVADGGEAAQQGVLGPGEGGRRQLCL